MPAATFWTPVQPRAMLPSMTKNTSSRKPLPGTAGFQPALAALMGTAGRVFKASPKWSLDTELHTEVGDKHERSKAAY